MVRDAWSNAKGSVAGYEGQAIDRLYLRIDQFDLGTYELPMHELAHKLVSYLCAISNDPDLKPGFTYEAALSTAYEAVGLR